MLLDRPFHLTKRLKTFYRWILAISIFTVIAFPLAEMGGRWIGERQIVERLKPIVPPTKFWESIFERRWQTFLEQYVANNIGLRSYFVLTYNEIMLRIFPKRPNANYVQAKELGFYPVDTIRRLNNDVLHHDAIRRHYERAAARLRVVQDLLGQAGVTLIVVPAPPKVRIYPEYVESYLVAPAREILRRAVSYGDVLEQHGINVVNVERFLLERKASSPWLFFSPTGFHWNYWAGCQVSNEVLRKAEAISRRSFFHTDCSDVNYESSLAEDADIPAVLNILWPERIVDRTPFPKIAPDQNAESRIFKMVVIGDSFSNQLVYAFVRSWPERNWRPNWLVRYGDFISRHSFRLDGTMSESTVPQPDSRLAEILTSDLVVLEVSDGPTYRQESVLDLMEFGFTRQLLDYKSRAGPLEIKSNDDAPPISINIISSDARDDVSVWGLSNLENDGQRFLRWALGPRTRVAFYLRESARFMMRYNFSTYVGDQEITVLLNGEKIKSFASTEVPPSDFIIGEVEFSAHSGVNTLEWVYRNWDKENARPLAIVMREFNLTRLDR
jgi:hypothetical protein